jgi:DNA (cytosine-5)-methyltransferase 1
VGFQFVDLFAGVGGFHHALGAMGGECVLAVELDERCQAVYRSAFPGTRLEPDIRALTRVDGSPEGRERPAEEIDAIVPDHDVLCAGFPCQPFSKSGFQAGLRDRTRGTLFFDIMTIILAKRPRFVILENVRNIAGPRHRDTWATIIESLREAGYRVSDAPAVVTPHLLAPWHGGAPQVRDRVFVLAHAVDGPEEARRGELLVERAPSPGWSPNRWDIRKILDREVDVGRYGIRPEERGWLESWQWFVQHIESDWLPGFPIWEPDLNAHAQIPDVCPQWKRDFLEKNAAFYREHADVIDDWRARRWGPFRQRVGEFPLSRRKLEWQARSAQPSFTDRDLESLVVHLRPSGIRVKPPTYLPALVAITQTSVLGPKVTGTDWRRLTPREAARLQGIPFEGFVEAEQRDSIVYRQLGNAVNVGVVRHVAATLFEEGGAPWVAREVARAV